VLVISTISAVNAQDIVYIPDANFKKALIINHSIDTNHDNEIQVSEASSYNGAIEVPRLGIKDLTGIEAFIKLTKLNCLGNYGITSLNLSKNINLTTIICSYNNLSSLNLSENTLLTRLNCKRNQLNSLVLLGHTYYFFKYCTTSTIETTQISFSLFFK
jgi:hypothetical protein